MRVVLATQGLHPSVGGPAFSVIAVGTRLANYGHDIRYWSSDRARYTPPGRVSSPYRPWAAEVVHAFGAWRPFMHLVCTSAVLGRVPLVFSPIGMFEPWALAQRRYRKLLAWHLYQAKDVARARAIHVTAEAELESVRALGCRNMAALIPHGVSAPSTLLEREAPDGIRTAVFMSRLEPKKGLSELLRAWRALSPRDWRLVIAGPDHRGYLRTVQDLIRTLQLGDMVTLREPVWGEDKYQLLCEADLFVLPTYSENFGLVIPEALAHGVPVITTRGAPWAELLETKSGWWTETGLDPLVSALRFALDQPPETLQAMGLRGRAMVLERYGWDSVVAKHEALYAHVSERGPRPAFCFDL